MNVDNHHPNNNNNNHPNHHNDTTITKHTKPDITGTLFRFTYYQYQICVSGPSGYTTKTVKAKRSDGMTDVILGSVLGELDGMTFYTIFHTENLLFSFFSKNGEWMVKGPKGHQGEVVPVKKFHDVMAYVKLGQEINAKTKNAVYFIDQKDSLATPNQMKFIYGMIEQICEKQDTVFLNKVGAGKDDIVLYTPDALQVICDRIGCGMTFQEASSLIPVLKRVCGIKATSKFKQRKNRYFG